MPDIFLDLPGFARVTLACAWRLDILWHLLSRPMMVTWRSSTHLGLALLSSLLGFHLGFVCLQVFSCIPLPACSGSAHLSFFLMTSIASWWSLQVYTHVTAYKICFFLLFPLTWINNCSGVYWSVRGPSNSGSMTILAFIDRYWSEHSKTIAGVMGLSSCYAPLDLPACRKLKTCIFGQTTDSTWLVFMLLACAPWSSCSRLACLFLLDHRYTFS